MSETRDGRAPATVTQCVARKDFSLSEPEERIAVIQGRVEELDRLLASHVVPTSANDPRTQSIAEMQYFHDRREERRLLLAELEELLKT